MPKESPNWRIAQGFVVLVICLVAILALYGLRDRLPPAGSKEACTVFLQRLKSEGISERTYRACKNAFPKGMSVAEIGACLNSANKIGEGTGTRRFYQFFSGEEREAHAQIWVTVDGDPQRVEGYSVEEPIF